jgi:rare lipoprotein A
VAPLHREIGMASFYYGGGRTASGTIAGGMTAAHRKLPFGSKVKVRDMKTGKEVLVTITDRGPFKKHRVIDLSHMAARELGITGRGVARVEVVAAN